MGNKSPAPEVFIPAFAALAAAQSRPARLAALALSHPCTHYRGPFHNPAMYLPGTLCLGATLAGTGVRYEASSYGRGARCPSPAAALFTVEDRIIKVTATIGFAIANIPD